MLTTCLALPQSASDATRFVSPGKLYLPPELQHLGKRGGIIPTGHSHSMINKRIQLAQQIRASKAGAAAGEKELTLIVQEAPAAEVGPARGIGPVAGRVLAVVAVVSNGADEMVSECREIELSHDFALYCDFILLSASLKPYPNLLT